MVSHRSGSGSASHILRVCGAVAAYAFALVTGTAVLIAAFGAFDDGTAPSPQGQQISASDQVMQRTAERGVQAPGAFLLAAKTISNDKRGF